MSRSSTAATHLCASLEPASDGWGSHSTDQGRGTSLRVRHAPWGESIPSGVSGSNEGLYVSTAKNTSRWRSRPSPTHRGTAQDRFSATRRMVRCLRARAARTVSGGVYRGLYDYACSGFLVGSGWLERTSDPDVLEVYGESVMVFESSGDLSGQLGGPSPYDPTIAVTLQGLTLHVLAPGMQYDTHARRRALDERAPSSAARRSASSRAPSPDFPLTREWQRRRGGLHLVERVECKGAGAPAVEPEQLRCESHASAAARVAPATPSSPGLARPLWASRARGDGETEAGVLVAVHVEEPSASSSRPRVSRRSARSMRWASSTCVMPPWSHGEGAAEQRERASMSPRRARRGLRPSPKARSRL